MVQMRTGTEEPGEVRCTLCKKMKKLWNHGGKHGAEPLRS